MELHEVVFYGYDIDNVYAVPMLEKEFSDIVNEMWLLNPPWKRYQRKLIEDLAVLSEQLENAIRLPQFERMTDEKNLYSIRHPKTPKNVRVIYTIDDGDIILLHAFLEKKKQVDYQRAIKIAKKRLKELSN